MNRLASLGPGALLGLLGAALYLLALTGPPGALLFAYVAQLPLFAAGFWLGIGSAVTAGVAASATVLAIGSVPASLLFLALNAFPGALLVRQALLARTRSDGTLEWYPPGLLAAWLAGLGLVLFGAAVAYLGGPGDIKTSLSAVLSPALDHLADGRAASRDELLEILALVTPGALAASWMVMTASNAMLAQGVLLRFGKAWRPSPDLAALTLPIWVSVLLAIAAVLSVFGGAGRFLGVNLLIVLSVPFCFAGLAVLHSVVRRSPRPQVPLLVFYVLAALFGWPLLVIAVVGALDFPLGLRQRLAAPGSFGGKIDD